MKGLIWNRNDVDYLIPAEEVVNEYLVGENELVMKGIHFTEKEKKNIEDLLKQKVEEDESFNMKDAGLVQEVLEDSGYDIVVDYAPETLEVDSDQVVFSPAEMEFVTGFETVKTYSWWDGSNWVQWILYPDDIETVVEYTDDAVNLDEWDGKNWVTEGTGLHQKVHRIFTIDGKKEEDTFILVKSSDWVGSQPIASILEIDALKDHLLALGRDVEAYMYEIGKLAGE